MIEVPPDGRLVAVKLLDAFLRRERPTCDLDLRRRREKHLLVLAIDLSPNVSNLIPKRSPKSPVPDRDPLDAHTFKYALRLELVAESREEITECAFVLLCSASGDHHFLGQQAVPERVPTGSRLAGGCPWTRRSQCIESIRLNLSLGAP